MAGLSDAATSLRLPWGQPSKPWRRGRRRRLAGPAGGSAGDGRCCTGVAAPQLLHWSCCTACVA